MLIIKWTTPLCKIKNCPRGYLLGLFNFLQNDCCHAHLSRASLLPAMYSTVPRHCSQVSQVSIIYCKYIKITNLPCRAYNIKQPLDMKKFYGKPFNREKKRQQQRRNLSSRRADMKLMLYKHRDSPNPLHTAAYSMQEIFKCIS